MIFLIEYNRSEGRLDSFRTFDELQRRVAEDSRLELELELYRRGVDHEVVLLEAENETSLHTTHRRYFATLGELLNTVIDELTVRTPLPPATFPIAT